MEDKDFSEFVSSAGKNNFVVEKINSFLLDEDCDRNIQTAKSGYTVSYLQDKKTVCTFVCWKTGIKLRIYPLNLNKYQEFLDALPSKIKNNIKKASVCKRLINPEDCNPKCPKGYEFLMDDEKYQKCRHMAFMIEATAENQSSILDFLKMDFSYK